MTLGRTYAESAENLGQVLFLLRALGLPCGVYLQPRAAYAPRVARTGFPTASHPWRVGTYPALAAAGGGYVWDEVLEYRVWCHPERGAPDLEQGSDWFSAFVTYPRALAFSKRTKGAEEPLALVLQRQYIDEPEPGRFVHVKKARRAEWPVELLSRPRRTRRTIPDFLAPDAPANRLEILRGVAPVPLRRRRRPEGR